MMEQALRVLIVEDSEDDALLLVRHLRQGGFSPVFERVETAESMEAALQQQPWDLIICDYMLPRFSDLAALAILKEHGLDLPFIVVSGKVGEEVAVDAMKAGAHDYILKDNLKRLVPAIKRELREAEVRKERRQAQERIKASNAILKLFSQSLSRKQYLDAVIGHIRAWSGCQWAAIRLLGDDGVQCELCAGNGHSVRESGKDLCAQSDECICTGVLAQRPASHEASHTTTEGSFYCNNTVRLIAGLPEAEQRRYHGACFRHGYLSLACIPIRYQSTMLGALHLADEREGKLAPDVIDFIELITPLIGEALYRFTAEEDLRKSREELRALSGHLESVREEERTHIAREMHDELGQTLTALKLDVFWIINKYRAEGAPAERMTSMLDRIDVMVQTVKRMASELRPSLLDHLGIVAALQWQAEQFTETTGIPCLFTSQRVPLQLDMDRSTAIFRIVQEALTNVARHAEATAVQVSLEAQSDTLALTIADNGRGIREVGISKGSAFGLLGIRERVAHYGGRSSISSTPDSGTTVSVTIPLG